MKFDDTTPRRTRNIGSKEAGRVAVQVIQPFATGHVCTEAEAHALNQIVAENVSNNLRDRITGFVPAAPEGQPYGETNPAPAPRLATTAEAQGLVDAYLEKYEMGVRQAGEREPVDPVEREVRNLAKERVKAFLAEKGVKQKDVAIDKMVDRFVEVNGESLTKEAQRIVRARETASKNSGDLVADLLDFMPGVGSGGDGNTEPAGGGSDED